jgi:DNA-binding transcriptional MerR regulator
MSSKKDTREGVIRGDSFEINFATYHYDEKFAKVWAYLRNRKHTVGESPVSYRVINHWAKKGILPQGSQSDAGDWKKFTFVELVWLKVVSHLRKFGVSLEKIASIKTDVVEFNAEKDTYFLLEYYIAQAIASSDDPYIIVWSDGRADLASANELEMSRLFFSDRDRLLIPLKPIVSGMGLPVKSGGDQFPLSNSEQDLIGEISMGKNSEVVAKINDGKITEIETTRSYPDATTLKDIEKTLEKQGDFADINIKVTGGKKRSVQVVKRKRMGHQSQ